MQDLTAAYKKKAHDIFAHKAEEYEGYFESLKPDLQKAGSEWSLKEYLSVSFLTIIVMFVVELPLLAYIFGFIPGFTAFTAILLSLTISIALSIGLFLFFYIYPSYIVGSRRKKIDYSLPFATLYMATTSGGNTPPDTMFRIVSEFGEYGEVSKECSKIVRFIDVFGMSMTEAIKRVADRSPSDEFAELLWGINTTTTAGGDVSLFLHEKAKGFMQDYRRRLEEYSDRLQTILEIYLTLIIVGSIFFIVMTTIMTRFGIATDVTDLIVTLQFFVVIFGLPLTSAAFIYILKQMSPRSG